MFHILDHNFYDMNDLNKTASIYRCFASVEKLRILNLLNPDPKSDKITIIALADFEKVLKDIKKPSIHRHLNDLLKCEIIDQVTAGKIKFYYLNDKQQSFIKPIIQNINDITLAKDGFTFKNLYRGRFLQSSKYYALVGKRGIIAIKAPTNIVYKIDPDITKRLKPLIIAHRKGNKEEFLRLLYEIQDLDKLNRIMWDKDSKEKYENLLMNAKPILDGISPKGVNHGVNRKKDEK